MAARPEELGQWGAVLGSVCEAHQWALREGKHWMEVGGSVCSDHPGEAAPCVQCFHHVCVVFQELFGGFLSVHGRGKLGVSNTELTFKENRTLAGGSGHRVWISPGALRSQNLRHADSRPWAPRTVSCPEWSLPQV